MRILLLLCGDPDAPVALAHGPYPSWFARMLGPSVALTVLDPRVDACDSGVLREIDAVIISGSPHAAYEPHPWIAPLEALVRAAVRERALPVLGVCFGHQLLAQALGGRVTRNPRGREVGTREIELNARGQRCPLLGALPARFSAQLTHGDTVAAPPPEARVLARSGLDDCQAFAVGRSTWGVQFHPEFTAAVMRSCIDARRASLARDGLDAERLLAEVAETDAGARLLARFVELVREDARRRERALAAPPPSPPAPAAALTSTATG